MSQQIQLSHVEVDRTFSAQEQAAASRIFGGEVRVVGRYAGAVEFIVQVVGKMGDAPTLTAALLVGAAGSGICSFVQWGFSKAKELAAETDRPESDVIAKVEVRAKGLTYVIQHRLVNPISEFEVGRIISSIDTWELHPDCARISVNLDERYIKMFEETGLYIADLPWPVDFQ